MNSADKTEIHRGSILPFHRRVFVAEEDALAGQSDGAAAETIDGFHEVPVDFMVQGMLHDGDGLGIGHAQAPDKPGGEAGLRHRFGDSLASAVDDHRIDPGQFQKDDIAQQHFHQDRVIHGTAAKFDEERLATETLQIGHRLDQDGGLGDLFGKRDVGSSSIHGKGSP